MVIQSRGSPFLSRRVTQETSTGTGDLSRSPLFANIPQAASLDRSTDVILPPRRVRSRADGTDRKAGRWEGPPSTIRRGGVPDPWWTPPRYPAALLLGVGSSALGRPRSVSRCETGKTDGGGRGTSVLSPVEVLYFLFFFPFSFLQLGVSGEGGGKTRHFWAIISGRYSKDCFHARRMSALLLSGRDGDIGNKLTLP